MNQSNSVLARPRKVARPAGKWEKVPTIRTESPKREAPPVAIMGIPFDNVTLEEAVDRIQEMIASGRPHYVVTANVDFLVLAAQDATLRRILINAPLVLCDGMPLVWASRWLGNPLPERVAGSDLVPELIRMGAERGQRFFFLGASPEANAGAIDQVRSRFPNIHVSGYAPPFRPLDEMDDDELVRRVREAQPDLLFVAFGCPKAEKWIAKNYRALGVPVVIGVGATLDFLAGRVKRAPLWLQHCGGEWLFRLSQEPRRLLKRYATDLWHFSREMVAQLKLMGFPMWRRGPAERAAITQSEPQPGWAFRCSYRRRARSCIRMPSRLDAAAFQRGGGLWDCAATQPCALEMTDVRFVDSTALALLLQLQKRQRALGQRLVLLSPSAAVERALRALRVRNFFKVIKKARDSRRARRRRAS